MGKPFEQFVGFLGPVIQYHPNQPERASVRSGTSRHDGSSRYPEPGASARRLISPMFGRRGSQHLHTFGDVDPDESHAGLNRAADEVTEDQSAVAQFWRGRFQDMVFRLGVKLRKVIG